MKKWRKRILLALLAALILGMALAGAKALHEEWRRKAVAEQAVLLALAHPPCEDALRPYMTDNGMHCVAQARTRFAAHPDEYGRAVPKEVVLSSMRRSADGRCQYNVDARIDVCDASGARLREETITGRVTVQEEGGWKVSGLSFP